MSEAAKFKILVPTKNFNEQGIDESVSSKEKMILHIAGIS